MKYSQQAQAAAAKDPSHYVCVQMHTQYCEFMEDFDKHRGTSDEDPRWVDGAVVRVEFLSKPGGAIEGVVSHGGTSIETAHTSTKAIFTDAIRVSILTPAPVDPEAKILDALEIVMEQMDIRCGDIEDWDRSAYKDLLGLLRAQSLVEPASE